MRDLTIRQAMASGTKRRTRPYHHKTGAFALTANFRDSAIDATKIRLCGALAAHFTQVQIAHMLNVGVATVGKMVRAYHFENGAKP